MKDPGLRETYNAEPFGEQWITILSVDLEADVPVWHFSMAVRDTDGEDEGLIRLQRWSADNWNWFIYKLREAFPPADDSRRVYGYTRPTDDPFPVSQHAVMKMTPREREFICDEQYGGRTVAQAEALDLLRVEIGACRERDEAGVASQGWQP